MQNEIQRKIKSAFEIKKSISKIWKPKGDSVDKKTFSEDTIQKIAPVIGIGVATVAALILRQNEKKIRQIDTEERSLLAKEGAQIKRVRQKTNPSKKKERHRENLKKERHQKEGDRKGDIIFSIVLGILSAALLACIGLFIYQLLK